MGPTPGAYNYVVTAHKPTSVTHSVVGNFTHDDELNLIVAKCTRLEIYLLTPEGLRAVVDAPIHGRVATLALFKPPLKKKHLIFLATERGAFCVLAYDSSKGELVTEAMGDLTDRIGRPAECGQIGIVDPECRVAGAHLYDGLFKCLPLDRTGQMREAFNVRLDELQVVDVAFLHGCPKPTIAVLHQDTKEARHVKTYEIDLKTKDLVAGPWAQSDLEGGTSRVIPVPAPLGGAILLGETVIVYVNGANANAPHMSVDAETRGKAPVSGTSSKSVDVGTTTTRAVAVATRAAPFMAHGAVDANGSRFLLSDAAGVLHLLVLQNDGERVVSLKLEPLGSTSIASVISYLDNGVAYVGSAYGDSQLVRLHAQPVLVSEDPPDLSSGDQNSTTFVEILETFPNLGPIVDMAVVDLDRHGQGQVVTCSGVAKDGSLRVVRNGVGIQERAAAELPGIKGCWSLKNGDDAPHDTFLVVTFMRETRVLAVDDASDEIGECEFEGFVATEQTLWTGNVLGGMACQVTSSGVRLVDAATGALKASWSPKNEHGEPETIGVASGNANVVVVATSGGKLVSLRVGVSSPKNSTTSMDVDGVGTEPLDASSSLIAVVATVDPGGEVACLDCSPLEEGKPAEACAVGLWSAEVKTFSAPGLALLSRAALTRADARDAASPDETGTASGGSGGLLNSGASASGVIPRAVLLCKFEGVSYLLVGTGDGGLSAFALDATPGAVGGTLDLSESPKTVSLGARPVTLRAFKNKNARHVFAGSDRPTVIYGNNGKLVFSNVNVPDVAHASPFDCAAFPDSLALCSDADLVIGGVDDIQKLHVRAVPLGEQPRRIAHQPATNTFAVLTQRENNSSSGDEHFVRLLDAETFETKHAYALRENENDGAVISCEFADDPNSYFVVGTAFAAPEEVEPSRGRVLVFKVVRDALVLVAEKEVKGAVYNLNAFNGKLLAGVNSKVQLFRWVARNGEGAASDGPSGAGATERDPNADGIAGDHELIGECSHHGHIVALYVQVRGDLIVVGDLMKSVSLLRYEPNESAIVELARDFNPNWMTAVDALDDDAYLGAENSFNLFTLRRNSDASTDEERSRLDVAGEFHLGEFVNRFRRGSLVAKARDAGDVSAECTLFGTVNGALGVLATLEKDVFEFALKVQNAMNVVVQGVGGLSHEKWRSFHNEHQTRPARGFVDGDVVERFLDLKKDAAKKVAALAGVSVEEITRRVEALQRVTH